MKIDAHQHFWKFDPVRDAWIDDSMKVIQRDFLPSDLKPILAENKIDGCVAVQADQSETETAFLLKLAKENNFIKGVVGWIDLCADNTRDRLAHFSENPLLKGIRHIAQGEADDFLIRPDVLRGIGLLAEFSLTYDILVFAHQLPAAIEMAMQFPNQSFVLDHIAKPKISEGIDEEWKNNIRKLAELQNVSCKISGMVTETSGFIWSKQDFEPFLDHIMTEFGVERVMYGSDWPVCLLAANYGEQLNIVADYISKFSETEQRKIMGDNASAFYRL
ncbi:amidohydrolase family protein [Portibacter lacus]|uniref:Amidohydrolase n=1 Tax=Portibacter lacus TaxID=1099794 RepID=A0AA37SVQ2_9BACT|nr:amidohydrolase family protein [Portibacter lacus]GLR18695.1 amidohydrolase [Portibacter lacus]